MRTARIIFAIIVIVIAAGVVSAQGGYYNPLGSLTQTTYSYASMGMQSPYGYQITECRDACAYRYGAGVTGECLPQNVPIGGRLFLAGQPRTYKCPNPNEFCYCDISPDSACDAVCKNTYNLQGKCDPIQSCVSIGNSRAITIGPDRVTCGDPTRVEKICCCRELDADLIAASNAFQVGYVLTTDKDCRIVGGTNYYNVYVAGIWGGGQALRISVEGGGGGTEYPVATTPKKDSVIPFFLYPTGPFSHTVKVPRSIVDANSGVVTVTFTVIPKPGMSPSYLYSQSYVPYSSAYGNTYAYYSTPGYYPGYSYYYPQQPGIGASVTSQETILCEVPPSPVEMPTEPPKEGAKPIDIKSITCTPPAPPINPRTGRSYQNPWYLVDLDRESWFQFAGPKTAGGAATGWAPSTPIQGTGAPGTVPAGYGEESHGATVQGTGAAGSSPTGRLIALLTGLVTGNATPQKQTGQCVIEFEPWRTESGTKEPEFYGLEIEPWGNDSIKLRDVRIGRYLIPNMNRTLTEGVNTISFSDYNISLPVKGRSVVLTFEYMGSPALREINFFPDVAIVRVNVTPTEIISGNTITITGTVTRKEYLVDGGTKTRCVYTYNASCQACIGGDIDFGGGATTAEGGVVPTYSNETCTGKPSWGLVPIPPSFAEKLQNLRYKLLNATGNVMALTPPILEWNLPMPDLRLTSPSATPSTKTTTTTTTSPEEPETTFTSSHHEVVENLITGQATGLLPSTGMASSDSSGSAVGNWFSNLGSRLANSFSSQGDYSGFNTWLATGATFAIYQILANAYGGKSWVQTALNIMSPIGFAWTMYELSGNTKECTTEGSIGGIRMCKVRIGIFTWWDIDGMPEADPDGPGDYRYYSDNCYHPTGLDLYLANAGVWTVEDIFVEALNQINREGWREYQQRINERYNNVESCEVCVKGFVSGGWGTMELTKFQGLKIDCEAYATSTDFKTHHVCCGLKGCERLPKDISCPTGDLDVTSKSGCSSYGTENKPGKWCAAPILIKNERGDSQKYYLDAKLTGQYESSVKCIPSSEACDVGWKEITDCNDEKSGVITWQKLKSLKDAEAARQFLTCTDCLTKSAPGSFSQKRVWCIKRTYGQYGTKTESTGNGILLSNVEGFCSNTACPASTDSVKYSEITSAAGCKADTIWQKVVTRKEVLRATAEVNQADAQLLSEIKNDPELKPLVSTCEGCLQNTRQADIAAEWCVRGWSQEGTCEIQGACPQNSVLIIKAVQGCSQDNRDGRLDVVCGKIRTAIQQLKELGQSTTTTVGGKSVTTKIYPPEIQAQLNKAQTLLANCLNRRANLDDITKQFDEIDVYLKSKGFGTEVAAPTGDASGMIDTGTDTRSVSVRIPSAGQKPSIEISYIINLNTVTITADPKNADDYTIYFKRLPEGILGKIVNRGANIRTVDVNLDEGRWEFYAVAHKGSIDSDETPHITITISSTSSTGAATLGILSSSEIPETEPSKQTTGSIPATGFATNNAESRSADNEIISTSGATGEASSETSSGSSTSTSGGISSSSTAASSFGNISATGMQTLYPGVSAGYPYLLGMPGSTGGYSGSTVLNALSMMGKMGMLGLIIDLVQKAESGQATYYREYYVRPTLGDKGAQLCPQRDPVFGYMTVKYQPRALIPRNPKPPTPATLAETRFEQSVYQSFEGAVTPINTSVFITIRNSTGGIAPGCVNMQGQVVPCQNVEIYSDYGGIEGSYRYDYNPPYNDTFYVQVTARGSVPSPAFASFNSRLHAYPDVRAAIPMICTKPDAPADFLVTITEPNTPLPYTSYNASVQPSEPDKTGIVTINMSGDTKILPSLDVDIQSNTTVVMNVRSQMPSNLEERFLTFRLKSDQYGIDAIQNLTHKVVRKPSISLRAALPSIVQSALREWTYELIMNNTAPPGCEPSRFYIFKEIPAGWDVWFQSKTNDITSIELPGRNATRINLNVLPIAIPGMGRYSIGIFATNTIPESIINLSDATALVADNSSIFYLTTNNLLRTIDIATRTQVSERNVGTNPSGLAIAGDRIYWGASGMISWSPKHGLFNPREVVRGAHPTAIAVDNVQSADSHVYWIEGDSIKRAPLGEITDCTGNKCIWVSRANAIDIAIDSHFLYWTTPDGTVVKKPKTTGSAQTLYRSKAGIQNIVRGLDGIYASYSNPGRIVKLQSDGSTDNPLSNGVASDYVYAVNIKSPADIAVNEKNIFWIEERNIKSIDMDVVSNHTMVYYEYVPYGPQIVINPDPGYAQPGGLATLVANITNFADTPATFTLRATGVPEGWITRIIGPEIVTLESSGNEGSSTTVSLEVFVNETAERGDSKTICISAVNGSVTGMGCAAVVVSRHASPTITATLLNDSVQPSPPKAVVGWKIGVTNNDPVGFDPGLFRLRFVLPGDGWRGFFLIGEGQFQNVTFTIPPSNSSEVNLYLQSPATAADGNYITNVMASVEGLEGSTNVVYAVSGCGNNVCEPERLEYDATGPKWCTADCSQGYNDFRCDFLQSEGGFVWSACDRTDESGVDFSVQSNIDYGGLSNVKMIACKRGSDENACISAATAGECGLTRVGASGVLSDCASQLYLSGNGAFGQRWLGRLNCTTDYNGEYYMLLSGVMNQMTENGTIRNVKTWRSANFSFVCPQYNLSNLVDMASRWQSILDTCQSRVVQLNAEGATTCAAVLNQVCGWRAQYLPSINDAIQNPTLSKVAATSIEAQSLEARISNRLQANCFNIPGLDIIKVTPPGTRVGEMKEIIVDINNSFEDDYRGYVECEILLPDFTIRKIRSGCYLFEKNSFTSAVLPINLTTEGIWNIYICSVFADISEVLPVTRCMEAPKYSTKDIGIQFSVLPADIVPLTPSSGETVSGTTVISVQGDPNINPSIVVQPCQGAGCQNIPMTPVQNQTNESTIFNTIVNMSTLPDGSATIGIYSNVNGEYVLLTTIPVVVDNTNYQLGPLVSETSVVPGTAIQLNTTLFNEGLPDTYVITCDSEWGGTITISGITVICGQQIQISLNSSQEIPVTLNITVPDNATAGNNATITVSNSDGDIATSTFTMNVANTFNSAPILIEGNVSPTRVRLGGNITFSARASDAENDAVLSVKACKDSTCSATYCDMTLSQGIWRCSSPISTQTRIGSTRWWIYLRDSKGVSAIFESPQQFVIESPLGNVCDYSCMSTCEPSLNFCINRTSYGQRNCDSGFVCCRESTIPNCQPYAGCAIEISSKDCIWDPVAGNYSINVVADWVGGAYLRLTSGGITSGRLTSPSAQFTARSASGGSKIIAASVYSSNDQTLCTNTTSVTCILPGEMPDPSPISSEIQISGIRVSSFQIGAEGIKSIDGDQFTSWQSQPEVPQWIKLDLGMIKTVQGVGIYSVVGRPKTFTISTSTDDSRYYPVTVTSNATYPNDWNVTLFRNVDTRWILVNITKVEGNIASVYEIKVYPPTSTPIPQNMTPPYIPSSGGDNTLLIIIVVIMGTAAAVIFAFRKKLGALLHIVRPVEKR